MLYIYMNIICPFSICYIVICRIINDSIIKTTRRKTQEEDTGRNDAGTIKMQEGRHKKTSLELYLPLTLLQGFERLACERMLETEHKLHILTPLL